MMNKTLIISIFRLLPIPLVLFLSVFWSNEKNLRLAYERKSEESMVRLMSAEEKIQSLSKDLDSVRRETADSVSDKRFLVEQLGQRDEHIRRLLAQMIQVLSGRSDIDLGEIQLPKDKAAWNGVDNELRGILTAPPIMAANMRVGLPQMAIEEKIVQAPAGVILNSQSLPPAKLPEIVQMKAIPTNTQVASKVPQQQDVIIKASPTVATTAESIELMPAIVMGEVMVVNQDHQFVVFNRGRDHGLAVGVELEILRHGKIIGHAEIETIYKKLSAATLLDGKIKTIHKGDIVRTTSPE